MVPSPDRHFGTVDGLIVLGGIAVAFSILWDMPILYEQPLMAVASIGDWIPDQFFKRWLELSRSLSGLLAFLLCAASATILVLNLRYPCPPLEHLACRPGFIAAATVMMIQVPGICNATKLLMLTQFAYPRSSVFPRQLFFSHLFSTMSFFTALAVLASWFTLILNRRWSPQPTWLDRAGRAVGWAWMIVAVL